MRFTKDHLWIEADGPRATLGVTAWAAERLGDILTVALPTVGATLNPGDAIGEIEGVQSTRPLAAPVAGKVADINAEVLDDGDLIETGPESFGWLVRLELADPAALDALMDRTAYETFLDSL